MDRQAIAELYGIWWDKHKDGPVTVSKLHGGTIKKAADPQGMDRLPPTCNFEASRLQKATCEFLGSRCLTGPCRWVGT